MAMADGTSAAVRQTYSRDATTIQMLEGTETLRSETLCVDGVGNREGCRPTRTSEPTRGLGAS